MRVEIIERQLMLTREGIFDVSFKTLLIPGRGLNWQLV